MPGDAARAAEAAARQSYGRLVAYLTARTRDVATAEDALAEAFAAALRVWPERGVPDRPEAWLLTAARREAGHAWRHARVRDGALATLRILAEEIEAREVPEIPDHRLRLLFACAHPAIDEAARTLLMLQTVLGLDAARIAAAFVAEPAAMGQRLVRAKAKIRAAGIPFAVPGREALPPRLGFVLSAIYAAFGTGWDRIDTADEALTDEAVFLARLVVDLLPEEPEPRGLLALLLHSDARRAARRDAAGRYVPLVEQDRRLWRQESIAEAEALLADAARRGRPGRFQTEAAIHSLHASTPRGAPPDAAALVWLYDLLAREHPAVGVLVARAVAHGARFGPARGLALLDAIPPEAARRYQPYWAARRHLAAEAGYTAAAEAARQRAVALTADPAVAAWLGGA